jgi:hypothetical protein
MGLLRVTRKPLILAYFTKLSDARRRFVRGKEILVAAACASLARSSGAFNLKALAADLRGISASFRFQK